MAFLEASIANALNAENDWEFVWKMDWTNCSTSSNETTSDGEPKVNLNNTWTGQSVRFTTKKGASQLNLTALTADDECGDASALAFNVTKTLEAQSGYYEGEKCAVLASLTPMPTPCKVSVVPAAASSISSTLTEAQCAAPTSVISCPPKKGAAAANNVASRPKWWAAALLSELHAARSVENTFSHRGVDCSSSTLPSIGDTWETFADTWGMAAGDLKPLNPDLDCSNFDEGTEYYVSGEAKDDEPTKTSFTSTAAETTTAVTTSRAPARPRLLRLPPRPTTSSVSDRELTQPGLSDDCDKFHKVVDEDSCGAIEASAGITHSQLSKWKTYINDSIFSPSSISGSISFSHANSQCSECSNIWLDF
ncbi:hypothetical protein N7541_010472 [Penicillium brevicompactum]|uniref:DUF7136 domain-containing protein n=1 Tax=Penicillium brevicompactum TaxID=5074 RepID=A0A9W9QUM4_PENBR|nr:hypothetical protein N7541_010472 [Penicillium brevicompactum]